MNAEEAIEAEGAPVTPQAEATTEAVRARMLAAEAPAEVATEPAQPEAEGDAAPAAEADEADTAADEKA